VFTRAPVVFQDLRSAEAYLQLFDALDHVNKLSDDIFGKITARVSPPKKIRKYLIQYYETFYIISNV
jgi:hypothetical protein